MIEQFAESNVVDIYDVATNQWSVTQLPRLSGRDLGVTSLGDKIIFANGGLLDIYDVTSGLWTTQSYSTSRVSVALVTIGQSALIAGGLIGNDASNLVEIYNTATNQWSLAHLSQPRYLMTATTVGQMTLFAGGLTKEGSNEVLSSTVDIYNQDTNQWLTSRLPQVDGAFQDLRAPISAVRTGKKVLFAGDGSNHVDIYNTEFINTPPTTTGIHNQTVLIGQSINIDLASAFSDAQTPSSLSLSTSGLPLGLGLINTTITGVPATTGTTSITVTAADPGGLSVNTSFSLTVQASGQNTSLSLLVPTYDCQTGAFRFNTIGGDGSPIEYYAVPGITGWTTNPNQFVDAETRTAADAQPITLKARQNGQEVMLVRDIRAVCPVSSAPFAITGVNTMSCQAITATERRLTFTPQYRGLTSEPFSFSVVNEMLPTSAAGPYNLRLYTDNPIITLKAQQGNLVASYSYNWLAVCSSPARSGSGEVTTGLAIKVLGNPVTGQTAEVEISGVTDQSVQINLADMQGKSVHTQRIEQAGAVERVSLSLGASNGVLLLQVSTPTQCQQVKLLRTN